MRLDDPNVVVLSVDGRGKVWSEPIAIDDVFEAENVEAEDLDVETVESDSVDGIAGKLREMRVVIVTVTEKVNVSVGQACHCSSAPSHFPFKA